MKTAFLVYKPILEYEDSLDPYCICLTRGAAEKVKKKIINWYKKILAKLPEKPEKSTHWMDDEETAARKEGEYNKIWDELYDKSLKIHEESKKNKPFENIDMSQVPIWASSYCSPEEWIGIVELEIK